MRFVRYIRWGVIITFVSMMAFLLIIAFYPVPKQFFDISTSESTKIYDRNGVLLYEVLLNEKGRTTYRELEYISPHFLRSIIAVEDKDFYSNIGVDFSSILRAIWQNIESQQVVSGGSTITQQLIRNVFHPQRKRTFGTKIEETILAIRLSFAYSKEEILELYVNNIYFGSLAYGVEAASQTYFGKAASELDLAEAAMLAGLPQAPSKYDPFTNWEEVKKRQEVVLRALHEFGAISSDELEVVKEQEITLKPQKHRIKAPHYISYILPKLEKELGRLDMHYNGLKVYTSIDINLQERIEEILQMQLHKLQEKNVTNGSVIVIQPHTGELFAMVGSKDYFSSSIDGEYNVALSKRQPGSAIKPLVYLAAFEEGYVPSTLVEDKETIFMTSDNLPYVPKNFNLKEHGTVTLRESLGSSLNIPAVKVLDVVGVSKVISMAKRMGISTFDKPSEHFGLSLTLGGADVKLIELTGLYGILANNGFHVPLRSILSIQYDEMDGESLIFPFSDSSHEKVVNSEYISMITDVLSDNSARILSFGEDNVLKTDYPSSVKTGTTRNFKDNWTLGYSPDWVVGVWVGNNDNSPMVGVSGITGAAPVWRSVMDLLHKGQSNKNFKYSEKMYKKMFCLEHKCMKEVYVHDREPHKYLKEEGSQIGHDDRALFMLIDNPLDDSVYKIDPEVPLAKQRVSFTSEYDVDWYLDGDFLATGKKHFWTLEPGQHTLEAHYSKEQESLIFYVVE